MRVGLASNLSVIVMSLLTAFGAQAGGATTSVQGEYLMTLYANLEAGQVVDAGMVIINASTGWVEGPRIKGKLVPPGGDWGRPLPSGVFRIDVRGTIQTDDGEIIFVSYNGIVQCPRVTEEKLSKGELIKSADCYFLAAPTFETKSEKYNWLNGLQAVAKMTEFKAADHITHNLRHFCNEVRRTAIMVGQDRRPALGYPRYGQRPTR
jgi:hypothetical protein